MKQTPEKMTIDWLELSLFDMHSHFTLSFKQLVLDVTIARDELTVTSIGVDGSFRKVHFSSENDFEMFLKMQLSRRLNE